MYIFFCRFLFPFSFYSQSQIDDFFRDVSLCNSHVGAHRLRVKYTSTPRVPDSDVYHGASNTARSWRFCILPVPQRTCARHYLRKKYESLPGIMANSACVHVGYFVSGWKSNLYARVSNEIRAANNVTNALIRVTIRTNNRGSMNNFVAPTAVKYTYCFH